MYRCNNFVAQPLLEPRLYLESSSNTVISRYSLSISQVRVTIKFFHSKTNRYSQIWNATTNFVTVLVYNQNLIDRITKLHRKCKKTLMNATARIETMMINRVRLFTSTAVLFT